MTNRPVVAVGQRWALRDARYEGWRYLTVEAIASGRVEARSNGRRRHVSWRADRFAHGCRWTFCGYDGPGRLPPFADRPVAMGCLSCPPKPNVLPLGCHLAPGFGWTTVYRDGEIVWRAGAESRKRLAHVELWARETSGDWRIRINSPLSERVYQRHDRNTWVLVAIGMGFA